MMMMSFRSSYLGRAAMHATATTVIMEKIFTIACKISMIAKQQLDSFIANYSPEVALVARQAFVWMRKKFPSANVLVYDNYNALAIGFAPTERASDAVFSIALFPRWVNFFFLQGAALPDPNKLLKGSGKRARSIRLDCVALLDRPAMLALIEAEAARSGLAPGAGSGKIVIKSISAKQRPRRPAPGSGKAAKTPYSI
jgi:hypothetical protein